MEKRLASIAESAVVLNTSKDTIRRLINSGRLKHVRVLRRVMVPVEELDRLCRTGTAPVRANDGHDMAPSTDARTQGREEVRKRRVSAREAR